MGKRINEKQKSEEWLDSGGGPLWVQEIIDGVSEGMRHMSAVRLVGRWYGLGLRAREVRMGLEGWNECNLPPLSTHELQSIIQSTRKWEKPRWEVASNGK